MPTVLTPVGEPVKIAHEHHFDRALTSSFPMRLAPTGKRDVLYCPRQSVSKIVNRSQQIWSALRSVQCPRAPNRRIAQVAKVVLKSDTIQKRERFWNALVCRAMRNANAITVVGVRIESGRGPLVPAPFGPCCNPLNQNVFGVRRLVVRHTCGDVLGNPTFRGGSSAKLSGYTE